MKTLVIGMGKSGLAAALFLKSRGHDVVCVDQNPDVCKTVGCASDADVSQFDMAVVSPGVPRENPIYQEALKRGIVVGEAELALRECHQPCVAITGTNGKTTVTLLVEHVLQSSGKKAKAVGNVGLPLTEYFLKPDVEEILVVELSSYQLETLSSKVIDAAVMLNITPDHLDRYKSMTEYAAAKCRIQECLKGDASLYVNTSILSDFHELLKGDYWTFGKMSGSYLWTDQRFFKELEKVTLQLPDIFSERGIHESENALAAWAICREFGITEDEFLQALGTFQKPAHRIEHVATIDGVDYVDDSKGTNIDATIQAVGAMKGPVYLIAGGVDKGFSYQSWISLFKGKVLKIFAIGQAAQKMVDELSHVIGVEIVTTLEEAVERASLLAKAGDTVLLSPGCSSFDMFRDYKHRGEEFKKCVTKKLEKSHES